MEQLRKDGDNTNNNRKYNLPETMEDIADTADMTTSNAKWILPPGMNIYIIIYIYIYISNWDMLNSKKDTIFGVCSLGLFIFMQTILYIYVTYI